MEAPAGLLSDETIRWMRARLPNQSKDALMDTFGISAATWVKLKAGQPVRASLVDRLRVRIATMQP
jgi:hypothetical protein